MVFPTTSETLRPQDPVALKKSQYFKYLQKIDISSHFTKKILEFVLKAFVTSFRYEFLGDSNT